MSTDRAWVFAELRKSLLALSRDGREALQSAPLSTCKADELALDYNSFLSAVLDNFSGEFTVEQTSALRRVDELLEAMSGSDREALWTDEAVCSHPRWREVRLEAQRALELLGWEK